jgi:NAD(P)H dehydrogenase (quinone)
MIIITGATGQLGSLVVRQLLERTPAEGIGVSVRDPAKAADLAARGVRVRRGDYTDPEALAGAFEGASQVFIVSSNSAGESAVAQHIAAIEAARNAGAQRVVYTSHQAAGADSLFAPMRDHAATEEHLSSLGLPYTSLRNGFYASTVALLLGPALVTGELVAPADGPVSWTTHVDLAAAAAAVLAGDGRLDGLTPALTAPATHDLSDVAAILSELSGRRIRRVVADDEEWAQGLVGHGVPRAQAQMLLGMFQASRRGEFAVTDPTLETLLGCPAQPLRTVLEKVVVGS